MVTGYFKFFTVTMMEYLHLEHLKDSQLVADFQNYFGVKSKDEYQNDYKETNGSHIRVVKNGVKYLHNEPKNLPSTTSTSNGDYVEYNYNKPLIKQRLVLEQNELSAISSCSEVDDSQDAYSDEYENEGYIITNKFWYYLFCIGTALGDEAFYCSFFNFWFWNIDGAVGRRVITVWAVSMYIGQGLKDIIKWPRPSSPPVFRMETKWALEYGMPSTHAMVGIAVPFSILIFTANRYQYPLYIGVAIATVWCVVVCGSRLYLGMHSVLDIVVGLVLVTVLLIGLIPFADWLDGVLLRDVYATSLFFIVIILLVIFYPAGDKWTPARGDTTMIMAVCAGVQIGACACYHFHIIGGSPLPPPYVIIWPDYEMLGLLLLRTVIGLCVVMATRAVFKSASYATVCALLHLNSKELANQADSIHNKQKVLVELSYKFITYGAIGFNSICLSPVVFKLIGIARPTFYTEV